MTCTHLRWVYPAPYTVESMWGTFVEEPAPYQEYTYEDIDVGRFRCTQCGEVRYYTGQWRDYFEKGIPCFGSDGVPR